MRVHGTCTVRQARAGVADAGPHVGSRWLSEDDAVGSNEGSMESKVLGVKSPLHGRLTGQLRLTAFDAFDMALICRSPPLKTRTSCLANAARRRAEPDVKVYGVNDMSSTFSTLRSTNNGPQLISSPPERRLGNLRYGFLGIVGGADAGEICEPLVFEADLAVGVVHGDAGVPVTSLKIMAWRRSVTTRRAWRNLSNWASTSSSRAPIHGIE